jgi:hypothetical protein
MSFTGVLMRASAIALGILGVLATFLPDTILGWTGGPVSVPLLLLVQVLGGLYLGFAALNWMSRGSLIGGIYSRPLAIGNLVHFLSAGLAMIKLLTRAPELHAIWPLAVMYSVFAVCFAIVLFRHPVRLEPVAS